MREPDYNDTINLQIPTLFGRDVLSLCNRRKHRLLTEAVNYWRTMGFPYETRTNEQIAAEFTRVQGSPLQSISTEDIIGSSSVGLGLANSFHPQIWHARSHGHRRSPFDYFSDDRHLKLMLERSPRFWPNNRCWSPQCVRNLSRIYAGGRVSNFRPVVARNIIARFSRENELVVDFSAGYGGRLLAAMSLNRSYLGIDPARQQASGLRKMQKCLSRIQNSEVQILHACAENALPQIASNSVGLVFSSPPFFNLEVYSDEPTQSSARYPRYELWRDCFLHVVIEQSRRILKRGRVLAINVSSTRSSPIEDDAVKHASGMFQHLGSVRIQMNARPLQRSQKDSVHRFERIHIFKKR